MKEKIKGFIGGILISTGTWMWVVNFQKYLIEVSPLKNQYLIGIILIVIGGYLIGKWQ